MFGFFKRFETKFPLILAVIYFFLLTYKLAYLPLFVADEPVYVGSSESIMAGAISNNNHPLLAKTVWAFFVYLSRGYFAFESPFVWRLGTVIFSFATLIVFFKILKIFFSKKVSLLGTVLLAIDPMYFAFSRLVMLDIISLFFSLGSLYFFLKFLRSFDTFQLMRGSLFLGLSLASKPSALFILIALPVYLLFVLKKLRRAFSSYKLFAIFTLLGFLGGNFLYFIFNHKIPFWKFVYEIFNSQLNVGAGSGFLNSPAISWFTTPQILTLFRIVYPDGVSTVLAFQNPLFALTTIIVLGTTCYLLLKGTLKPRREISLILIYFAALFLPWFLSPHPTYYFYIVPLIPLVIILFLKLISLLKINAFIFPISLAISLTIFALYYPLLIGLKVSKNFEAALFSYSRYKFPAKDTLFCLMCSPR